MIEEKLTVLQRAAAAYSPVAFTRADLISAGMSSRAIASAVRGGHLVHVRRDRYVLPSATEDVAEAVRIGGRLTCLSLLASMGVFVHRGTGLHIAIARNSCRLRRPRVHPVTRHWNTASGEAAPIHVAPLIDAVRHAMRCQTPRAAVATLDSLRHERLLTAEQLQHVFDGLPARFRPILVLVDGSAGSGPETFVRLMLRAIGVVYETQVFIDRVGYVDFLVDGWLIIECDSKEFHEGWAKQKQDRARDLEAARQGYVTVRPMAADILGDPAAVQQMLREIIEALGPRVSAARRSQFSQNMR